MESIAAPVRDDVEAPIEDIAPTRRRRGHGDASGTDGAKAKVRITCQFRDSQAMVYDLISGPRRIEVRMQPPPGSNGWSVALVVKSDGGAHSHEAVGETRLSALEAIEHRAVSVLALEEWRGLREALKEVRAL